jgi:hypothetical protein
VRHSGLDDRIAVDNRRFVNEMVGLEQPDNPEWTSAAINLRLCDDRI